MHIEKREQDDIIAQIMDGFPVRNQSEIHAALFIVFESLRDLWKSEHQQKKWKTKHQQDFKVYNELPIIKRNGKLGRMDTFIKIGNQNDPNDREAIVIEFKNYQTAMIALNQAQQYKVEIKSKQQPYPYEQWPTTYVGIALMNKIENGEQKAQYKVAVEEAQGKTGWTRIVELLKAKNINLRKVLNSIWGM